MKKQKENAHENISWSEMGKQNVQAKGSIASQIAEEVAFGFCFSALPSMWLPRASKSDNVWRLLLQLKTIDLYVLLSHFRTRDVTLVNRFFQIVSYECAYVRITY
mgnify:CR=1 FL=1